jgi:glycosyltransferase involved in cell wall biosynthesis
LCSAISSCDAIDRASLKKILYVHHRPELGGAPSSLSHLIAALDRARFEPHVYCPPGPVTRLFESVGAFVHEGPVSSFTHIWASTYRGRRWMLLARELQKLPRHLVTLERTLRSESFDIVHLNDSPLVAAAWLARRRRLPIVWHLRSALPGHPDRRTAFLQRTIASWSTQSLAITRDVASSFGVNAEIVPNGVDLTHFQPGDHALARQELGLRGNLPVVTFLGFLYPSKGFRDFIVAASLLNRRGARAQFLIVGGPVRGAEFFSSRLGRAAGAIGLARDYGAEALSLVKALGLDADVQFLPFTKETPLVYQASDIVVAPSRGPELGRPVIEAAACGRPVIASGSLDGAGILLPSVTGELVPRRSPDALAAALDRLLGDEGKRREMGVAAREHAIRTFDQSRNGERVMEIYDRMLGSSS